MDNQKTNIVIQAMSKLKLFQEEIKNILSSITYSIIPLEEIAAKFKINDTSYPINNGLAKMIDKESTDDEFRQYLQDTLHPEKMHQISDELGGEVK